MNDLDDLIGVRFGEVILGSPGRGKAMKTVDVIVAIQLVVGAVNWEPVGAAHTELITLRLQGECDPEFGHLRRGGEAGLFQALRCKAIKRRCQTDLSLA